MIPCDQSGYCERGFAHDGPCGPRPGPERDCAHGRQRGKCADCDVMELEQRVVRLANALEELMRNMGCGCCARRGFGDALSAADSALREAVARKATKNRTIAQMLALGYERLLPSVKHKFIFRRTR